MIRKLLLLLASLVSVVGASTGCNQLAPVRVRALPLPAAEVPPVNLPKALRQRNWLSANNEGSCVHASFTSHLRWHNQFGKGERWRKTYSGGENEIALRRKLSAEGIRHVYTDNGDPSFLDWCSKTRHGCILWWKPSHCCTFCGWVRQNGKIYAAILDNNYPERIELTERNQFVRLWNGYGGFALSVIDPPTTPIPAPAYEVIR